MQTRRLSFYRTKKHLTFTWINKWPWTPNVCFSFIFLGLIYVIGPGGRFRCGGVREPHMCISSSYHLVTFVCLCDGEKGYSDYRYDHVAFLGFRYYHSIEYTKLDWLKASGYRNFKIQTSGLPRIYLPVRKETSAVFRVSHRSIKVRA